jgi:tetratricopeptide (TPR) repeat protein
MITAYPRLSAAQQALDANRYQEAAQIALAHLRENPQDARGLGLLGTVAMRTGALWQAEQFLRQAFARAPQDKRVLQELAFCLQQQDRPVEAIEMYRRLELQQPDDSKIGFAIASLLEKLDRHDEALPIFERLIEQFPDRTPHWIAYGHSLRFAGSTDDAIAAYRRSTEIDPEIGEAWWALASIKSNVLTDADIDAMTKALEIAIDAQNIAPLHFASARAWHDRKEYEKAFHHYAEGNRIRAESIGYDSTELTDEIGEVSRLPAGSWVRGHSADGPTPLFIVSLPRSGSTLLEQMLGSHPEVEAVGELPYIPALLRMAMEMHTRRGPTTIPQMVASMSDEEAQALGREYMRRVEPHRREGKAYFVDKLPHNWSNIPFIRRILPKAKFIDIRRPAMDCCFANFTQSFSRAHAASFALKDIGQCYVDYVRLMDHLAEATPDLVHHVSYERLIDDPEQELRAIFTYARLAWDEGPLNFQKLDRVVRTPSVEQVRRPLNRSGFGVWRPYDQWLGPLRETLGGLAND